MNLWEWQYPYPAGLRAVVMLPLSEVVELETISGWPYAAKAAANYAWVMRSYSLAEFASATDVVNATGVVRKDSL